MHKITLETIFSLRCVCMYVCIQLAKFSAKCTCMQSDLTRLWLNNALLCVELSWSETSHRKRGFIDEVAWNEVLWVCLPPGCHKHAGKHEQYDTWQACATTQNWLFCTRMSSICDHQKIKNSPLSQKVLFANITWSRPTGNEQLVLIRLRDSNNSGVSTVALPACWAKLS